MNKKIINAIFILSAMVSNCLAGGCARSLELQCRKVVKPDPVENVLKQLRQKTAELKSYQCLVEYEVNQPTFESKTLRKGILYYKKTGKESTLRMNFRTFKQDDEKEEKYIDQYIINGSWLTKVDYQFDGVWLTHIDHQLKTVACRQLAEPNDPNEPVDAFELIGRNFPIVGFTKVEELKKEFEIKLFEQKRKEPPPVIPAKHVLDSDRGAGIHEFIQLHLKVKPESVYKDDYTTIDFWIDKKLGLPAKFIAVSTERDIYQIKFIKPKINKKIDKKVFGIKIPKGFSKPEIFPLKKAEKNKDTRPKTDDQI
jgi:outer membrane lipoprotein-sorting protein